jgi:hypothetical protein
MQLIHTRLQKEKDQLSDEFKKLEERYEYQTSQILKSQRDKETIHTEVNVLRERLEKVTLSQQKLQVNINTLTAESLYQTIFIDDN